jgi:hypothetical protein
MTPQPIDVETIAKAIEADEFWKSPELNERQVHAVLAMRLRMAKLVRNFSGRL